MPRTTTAKALALHRQVIAQHHPQHKIFFGGELVYGFGDEMPHDIEALVFAEIKIYLTRPRRLLYIVDMLAFESLDQQFGALIGHCAQHEITHPFLLLVNLVKIEFHRIEPAILIHAHKAPSILRAEIH